MTSTEIAKGKRITGQDRVKLAADLGQRYAQGATVRDLHNLTGRSFGSIQRLLAESGVEIRPRGGSRKKA